MATAKSTKTTTKSVAKPKTTKSVAKPTNKSTKSKESSKMINQDTTVNETVTFVGPKTIYNKLPKVIKDSITNIHTLDEFIQIASSSGGISLSKVYLASFNKDVLDAFKDFEKVIEINIVLVNKDKKIDIVDYTTFMYALNSKSESDSKDSKELKEPKELPDLTNKLTKVLTTEDIKVLIQTRDIINKIINNYLF